MNRTKGAILALFLITGTINPEGPPWLRVIMALIRLGAVGYLCWYGISDTKPVETYTRKIAAGRQKVRDQ